VPLPKRGIAVTLDGRVLCPKHECRGVITCRVSYCYSGAGGRQHLEALRAAGLAKSAAEAAAADRARDMASIQAELQRTKTRLDSVQSCIGVRG
jgi:hypothetical protein